MSSNKLSELKAQIAQLQKEESEIIKADRNAVIKDIQEKLNNYDIKIEELQKKTRTATTKSPSVIKYRKDSYLVWVGRGPKPQWVKTAEANGEDIERYRV
jgi:DNA-binding protein H-NS